MGSIDMSSGQRFERRIGRRVDVEPVHVTFFVPESGRFRKKVASHEVPAQIENVSVTGAAILGPSTVPWSAGDRVVVRSQGADNVVVVRHRHETPGGTRFGVELTRTATTLKRQIQQLLEPHLISPHPPAAATDGPVLGLRKAPIVTNPVLPHLPEPRAEGPATTEPEVATPGPLHGPGPVIDLSGPEPVLDITDAVMGLEPDLRGLRAAPEPDAAPAPSDPVAEPLTEPADALPDEPVAELAPEPVDALPDEAPVEEPAPEVMAEAATEVDPDPEIAERAVAPHAPAPRLPHSPGRQVLDEVFGLMED